MSTCVFCDYTGEDFRACEYSSPPDYGDVYLCGNLECPRCTSCQGQHPTPELRRAAILRRRIFEGEVPPAVLEAILTRYGQEDSGILERILKELQYSSLNRCWFFTYAGMVHGVEPDGYIHT